MRISHIIQRMQGISDKTTVFLYVDDLLIFVHDVPSASAQYMAITKAELDMFSITTAILLKGF